jgi:hypothetical protein
MNKPTSYKWVYGMVATIVFLSMVFTAGCGPSKEELANATSTAEAQIQATADAEKEIAQQTAAAGERTSTAQALAAQTATADMQTQQAIQTATATAIFAKTAAAEQKATQNAEKTMLARTATQEAAMGATQQAKPMADIVQKLFDDGVIHSLNGKFSHLPKFNKSWAQIQYYQWWPTGYEATDFVIRSDITWESASNIANWFASGCGFVFRATDEDNYYMMFLSMDGWVEGGRQVKGISSWFQDAFYHKLDVPKGSANLMIVNEKDWIYVFVNDKRVFRTQDIALTEGNLAYTLVSGTNKDYGTRCTWENVQLWEIK